MDFLLRKSTGSFHPGSGSITKGNISGRRESRSSYKFYFVGLLRESYRIICHFCRSFILVMLKIYSLSRSTMIDYRKLSFSLLHTFSLSLSSCSFSPFRFFVPFFLISYFLSLSLSLMHSFFSVFIHTHILSLISGSFV